MLIFSLDGETFTKFAGNPVIPKPEEWHDFRDPKVNIMMTYYIIITISLIIDVINVNSVIIILESILIVT